MRLDDFSEFYRVVHGHPPFPWQARLARLACDGDWPPTLSLPTSSGKTSAIDVAVFALAWQAERPAAERTARLRTAFVVDRRVVVDESYAHAERIAEALRRASDPLLAAIAARLRRFAGQDADPLCVALLRGGVARDERWAETPNQPTILVSTVDQVGSRLLFRGYGLSGRSRPIHAGLLGIDTRLVLDEAHLSGPFEDTVAFVVEWQRGVPRVADLPPGLALTRMTATPRVADPFGLTSEDRDNPVLSARLGASKVACARVTQSLERDAANAAAKRVGEGKVVGVVLNRVAAARQVFELLRQQLNDPSGERTLLLTGRARPFERDKLIEAFRDRVFARPGRPSVGVVVVATQTVEVGANLDFDHLITEIAPLDALRQRFGRLNRLGNHREPSHADILVRRESVVGNEAGKDPVYGDRLVAMWRWIEETGVLAEKDVRTVDFGVDALDATLSEWGGDRSALASVAPTPPVATPAQVRSWTRTYPAPDPDPPVAPYLHGRAALDAADVTVIWRADLGEDADTWAATIAAVPPRTGEGLPLRRAAVIAWLRGAPPVDMTDLEGPPTRDAEKPPGAPLRVLRWAGREDSAPVEDPGEIRPGDVIVVPARYGGVDPWGWNPSADPSAAARDIADDIARQDRDRRRTTLRLHPNLLSPHLQVEAFALYTALRDGDMDPDERRELHQRLADLFDVNLSEYRLVRYAKLPDGGIALAALPRGGPTFADDDEDDSLATARRVTLEGHSEEVESVARAFASRCVPSEELAEAIVRAGWLHDVGKADHRMQAWLAEGTPDPDRPLAKSGMDWRDKARNRAARQASGYPPGARHEIQSVALVQSSPAALAGVDADLVLHLIGTHHGFGRGLPPVVIDEDPIEVSVSMRGVELRASSDHGLYRLGSGWSDRFDRLQNEYGPWGLAWLEAVLRLADHRASEKPTRGVE